MGNSIHWASRKQVISVIVALLFPFVAGSAPAARSETMKNLKMAIEAEANAVNKYQLFAHKAEQEGFDQVAKLFRAAAEAETIHRHNHQLALTSLGGQPVQVKLKPVQVGTTQENLAGPIRGEAKEQSQIYPRMIRQAENDHAPQAARSFEFARETESEHEQLFKNALKQLGHNPLEDYYVSQISGETIAVPEGHVFAKAKTGEYVRVS